MTERKRKATSPKPDSKRAQARKAKRAQEKGKPPKEPPAPTSTFREDAARVEKEWQEPTAEHKAAASRICTCGGGHDEYCPVHGTDDFGMKVKREVGAHLLANEGTVEPFMGKKVKQRKLDGSEVDLDDVEVERVSKTGVKLKAGLFKLTISDDDAEELREEDPVTRRVQIAAKMHARKDGGRVPNGADWDRALDKLTLKVEAGW